MMLKSVLRLPVAIVVLLACASVAPARAPAQVLSGSAPDSASQAPDGFRLAPRDARRVAERQPAVVRERAAGRGVRATLLVPQYFGDRRYEIVYLRGDDVRVDVHVDGISGKVLEIWTGPQADNLLARGYDPPIGRSLNKPYVWLALAALFVLPFVDPRRPLRLIHFDLLVLLGFGVSQLYFNRGQLDVSVPLVYPLLVYLLARMLGAGVRPRETSQRLTPLAPVALLAVGLVVLVAFRIGLNAVDSHTIDVGQQSVFGADRIEHGEPLYTRDGEHGDTYGPVTYLAYVPFETLFPADGPGGYDRAAKAAAITFDLLAIAGLILLGTRLRPGREGGALGLSLAYAWAAYPFSLYALQANTNDGLIAALLVFALVVLRTPPLRGLMLGLATAAKFVPLALAPLMWSGTGEEERRSRTVFAGTLVLVMAAAVLPYLPDGGLREFYDTTIGHQLGRQSPFSLWGLHPSLTWLQTTLKLLAASLAVAVAFVPRRRSVRQVAALGAAVLIAVELTATHWFYFYLVWFAPLAFVAILGAYRCSADEAWPSVPPRRPSALRGPRAVARAGRPGTGTVGLSR